MDARYSSVQWLSFGCLLLGTLMCVTGAAAPYWITGDYSSALGETSLSIGIIWGCTEILDETTCTEHDMDDLKPTDYGIMSCLGVQMILCIVAGLAVCLRMGCCEDGKTIFHGVVTFFAGGAGLSLIAVFCTTDRYSVDDKPGFHYDWAFYVYTVGAVILVIVSFFMCVASLDGSVSARPKTAQPTVTPPMMSQQPPPQQQQQQAYPMYTY